MSKTSKSEEQSTLDREKLGRAMEPPPMTLTDLLHELREWLKTCPIKDQDFMLATGRYKVEYHKHEGMFVTFETTFDRQHLDPDKPLDDFLSSPHDLEQS